MLGEHCAWQVTYSWFDYLCSSVFLFILIWYFFCYFTCTFFISIFSWQCLFVLYHLCNLFVVFLWFYCFCILCSVLFATIEFGCFLKKSSFDHYLMFQGLSKFLSSIFEQRAPIIEVKIFTSVSPISSGSLFGWLLFACWRFIRLLELPCEFMSYLCCSPLCPV